MAYPVEIIAHRGASHLAPENTLASVNLAWKLGADSVEVDVYVSKDGRIVAIHDESTKRTAGVDWKVAERTLAELRTLEVGRWKAEAWAGQRIPTLEEVLATVPDGKQLLIEVKCGEQIVPELARTLRASGKNPAQTVTISFDFDTVAAAKKTMPQSPVLWVLGTTPKRDQKTGKVLVRLEDCIEKCRGAGLDGLSVRGDSELGEDFVRQVHDAGLKLSVWTINSAEDAKKLVALGVDAITTDRPGWLRTQLGN